MTKYSISNPTRHACQFDYVFAHFLLVRVHVLKIIRSLSVLYLSMCSFFFLLFLSLSSFTFRTKKKSVDHVYRSFLHKKKNSEKLNLKKAMNFFSLLCLVIIDVLEKSLGKILTDQINTDFVSKTKSIVSSSIESFRIRFH